MCIGFVFTKVLISDFLNQTPEKLEKYPMYFRQTYTNYINNNQAGAELSQAQLKLGLDLLSFSVDLIC